MWGEVTDGWSVYTQKYAQWAKKTPQTQQKTQNSEILNLKNNLSSTAGNSSQLIQHHSPIYCREHLIRHTEIAEMRWMVCLLKVNPFSATSCRGTFLVEYPTRFIFPYHGLCLPPEKTKGSGHCEGGWWGGSGRWLCLLHEKLARSCWSCVSPASAEGPPDGTSTVPSPPCISNIAFSLVHYDWCQIFSGSLLTVVSETVCSRVRGNHTFSWREMMLCHWFLDKLCLVVSADHPHLWLLLVLSFPSASFS